MKHDSNKTVLIIGASGGLGSAFARKFAAEGFTVLLTARKTDSLLPLSTEVHAAGTFALDITNGAQIETLAKQLAHEFPKLSVVVNATGYDVRKSFVDHTAEEIAGSLNINLQGAMLITHAFLPAMLANQNGYIVHVGGFADGRLAFPYYAANFASRAGLRGFVDSLNREIDGTGVRVGYFSPSPTETEAERPFHELWRQMNIEVVPMGKVSSAMVDAVEKKQAVVVMGGLVTRVFGHTNAIFPRFADRLALNHYRKVLSRFLGNPQTNIPMQSRSTLSQPKSRFTLILGIGLAILSFLLYGIGLLVVPFLALETGVKAVIIPALLASGEIAFWIGIILAGKEVISKYRQYLNPCNWIQR